MFVLSSQWASSRVVSPSCRVHWQLMGCSRKMSLRRSLFCFRSCVVVAPVAIFPVVLMIGGSSRRSACSPCSFGCLSASVVLSTLMSMSLSPSANMVNLPCPLSSSSRGRTLPSPFSFVVVAVPVTRLVRGGLVGFADGTWPSRILFGTLLGFESSNVKGVLKFNCFLHSPPSMYCVAVAVVAPFDVMM